MADETKEYELDHAHTQHSGRERNTVDKFYTKDIVARHYCDKIQQYLTIDKVNDFILEPSQLGADLEHYLKEKVLERFLNKIVPKVGIALSIQRIHRATHDQVVINGQG